MNKDFFTNLRFTPSNSSVMTHCVGLCQVVVEGATRTAVMAHPAAVRGDTRILLTTRETGTNLIGSCSSAQTASIAMLHPETSISCHLSFTSDAVEFSAHDVYLTHISFDPSTGKTCSWAEGR